MKILYFGGQKCGKSSLAEQKTVEIATNKPYYIATYDSSFDDSEMERRVFEHRRERGERFITIESTFELSKFIEPKNSYLVDCLTMWLLNNIDKDESELKEELSLLKEIDANIVFVLNDIGSGVIPMDSISRRFVDLSGIIGQFVALMCDEVYEVKFGIGVRVK